MSVIDLVNNNSRIDTVSVSFYSVRGPRRFILTTLVEETSASNTRFGHDSVVNFPTLSANAGSAFAAVEALSMGPCAHRASGCRASRR